MLSDAEAERFWSKVKKLGPDDCWEWQAVKSEKGYGRVGVKGKMRNAHRIAFVIANQVDYPPRFMSVRHSCDNPSCCNPSHLSLGTTQDNMNDKVARRRHQFHSREQCQRGHEYTAKKVLNGRTYRRCLECERQNRIARELRARTGMGILGR